MVELGKKLRELRVERKLTQKQVAQRLGVTASIISAYENDIRQPSFDSLVKLSRLYNVSTDYLLGVSSRRTADNQHLIGLDGLTPAKISLVTQLVSALKE